MLGEVLWPEPWKHEMSLFDTAYHFPTRDKISSIYQCDKCQHKESLVTNYNLLPMSSRLKRRERLSLLKERQTSHPCTVPDLIPLDDWNVAMKWRDWAVGKYGQMAYGPALAKVSGVKDDYSLAFWLMTDARPADYLKAAALCKLEGE